MRLSWNSSSFKEADNSFQHVSNSYFLKDEYYNCYTNDATIIVSCKGSIIFNQVAVTIFYIHSNNMTC